MRTQTLRDYVEAISGNLVNILDALKATDHPEADTVKGLIGLCDEALEKFPKTL